jgi:hypothetical protein
MKYGNAGVVASNVCEKEGHSLCYLPSVGETMCSKCGMTIAEIRGEVKEPEPEPVNA